MGANGGRIPRKRKVAWIIINLGLTTTLSLNSVAMGPNGGKIQRKSKVARSLDLELSTI